jgi:subtilisin family serine protease
MGSRYHAALAIGLPLIFLSGTSAGSLGRGRFESGCILVHTKPQVAVEWVAQRHGFTVSKRLDAIGWYELLLPPGTSVLSAAAALASDPGVQSLQPNYLLESPETDQIVHAFIDGTPSSNEYHDQTAFLHLEGPEAWAYSSGAPTLVAVLDTGVDLDHPALAGRIAGNGFDFVDNDAIPDDAFDGIDEDLDGDIDEGTGHGTHIAGIITLVHPQAIVLPVRVLNSDGFGDVFDVAQGLIYAVQQGAPVINMSLGLLTPAQVLEDAVAYAIGSGANIVASAGNRNTYEPQYPAAYPGVIAVAATDNNQLKAEFSNFGAFVDLAAPGIDIYSTFADGQYATWSGTSFATAFVTGQSALLMSVDTALTPQQTNPFILDTAENEDPGYDLGAGEVTILESAEEASEQGPPSD